MRNLRLLFLVALATVFISEKLFVSSQSPSTTDDLYLEAGASGDFPIDDEDGEDGGSGSASGDYALTDSMNQDEKLKFFNFTRTTVSKEMAPQPTTAVDNQHPTPDIIPDGDSKNEVAGVGPTADGLSPSSESPSETTETGEGKGKDEDRWDATTPKDTIDEVPVVPVDNEILAKDGRGSELYKVDSPKEVTSENTWERTDVLAAVIACGVVGFLCAVFLLLLLAYRMKKKDEGSYELGDSKMSNTQYHKAPTKEFYA